MRLYSASDCLEYSHFATMLTPWTTQPRPYSAEADVHDELLQTSLAAFWALLRAELEFYR